MTESNSDHATGLSKQKASLTVLVASTLDAKLSAVPQSQKAQADLPAPQKSTSHEVGVRQKSPERRARSHHVFDSSTPDDSSNMDTGNRKRINLTRLHFNAKKSAASESSRGEALTVKQDSFNAVSTSPPSVGMATATSRQISQPSLGDTSLSSDRE